MHKYLEKYLSFNGRFGRKQYIFRNILIGILEFITFFFMGFIDVIFPKSDIIAGLAYLVVAIIFLFLFIASMASIIRRWHDLNNSTASGVIIGILPVGISVALSTGNIGYAQVLGVILVVPVLVMLFQKGTNGENEYGPDPLQTVVPKIIQPTYNSSPAESGKKVQKIYGVASVTQPSPQQSTFTTPPPQQSNINFSALWELKKLLDEGVITQEEFTAAKKKILG